MICFGTASSRQTGVTLIELMVAMVLGLLVAGGIVTVFLSTSSSNRVQNQMARLQEEGRYAITRLSGDLRMANAQYCTSTGGVTSNAGGVYLSPLRAPTVQASTLMSALSDVTTPWGSDPYPDEPTTAYDMPSFLSMRGYDCDKDKSCKPVNPSMLPEIGTTADKRVVGSSVLTLRYMDSSSGWALGGKSKVTGRADGTVDSISIEPGTGEPTIADYYKPNDLMMLADCSNAQIFAVSLDGSVFSPLGTKENENLAAPIAQQPLSAPKLFNFSRDYNTVTYYLKVVDDGNGQTTGALIRRLNGSDSEVVRGVERLDFLYGVEEASGATRYLTADEIDTGAIPCPPSTPRKLGTDYGCLWRAVKNIEAHVLMAGQQPIRSLTDSETNYVYSIDGDKTPASPTASTRVVQPKDQGFSSLMLRREFSVLISVRNYNP